jgi:hypothetical protein
MGPKINARLTAKTVDLGFGSFSKLAAASTNDVPQPEQAGDWAGFSKPQ